MTERWPEDMEWRRFAARIADGVTRWINDGGKITVSALGDAPRDSMPTGRSCKCPLGTLVQIPFPDGREVRTIVELDAARYFIRGFDNEYVKPGDSDSPYWRLGRAYRRRFVTKDEP